MISREIKKKKKKKKSRHDKERQSIAKPTIITANLEEMTEQQIKG